MDGRTHGREAFETRLPPLGPRGEGWIGLQMLLEIGSLVVAPLTAVPVAAPAAVVLAVLGTAVMVAGILLFAWGASTLGSSFSVWVDPRPVATLVTGGPYRYARHPICTAQVLIVAGWALVWVSPVTLVLAVAVAAYLDRFKLAREEQTLLARYPTYRDYQAVVPHRMVPSAPIPRSIPPRA